MTSVLQGGFLNRMAGSSSKKCLSCQKVSRKDALACHSCESYVCRTCTTLSDGYPDEMRECDSCSRRCCERCRDVCHDQECRAMHCKVCSNMEPCSHCHDTFCTNESEEEMECAARCDCNQTVCNSCHESCNLCSAVLCDACVQECSKCGDVFCSACKNFLVQCEFCDKESCLICCTKKTPCVTCGKAPSFARHEQASSQLARVQRGIRQGASVAPVVARAPTTASSADEENFRMAEHAFAAELKRRVEEEKERRAREEQAAHEAASQLEAEEEAAAARKAAGKATAVSRVASSNGGGQRTERGTNIMPKKGKKKKKKKGKASASVTTVTAADKSPPAPEPAAAAAAAAATVEPAAEFAEWNDVQDTTPAFMEHEVDDRVMDHSVIKKWVLEVASRQVVTTLPQMKLYFHGRVDTDVIDSYMEVFSNNCRDTVIQCAEFLNIKVPTDAGQDHEEEEQQGHEHDHEPEHEHEQEQEVRPAPDEGVNDDLVAGAFAARERVKQGDYDFAEHPLEKRANEAKQNECKDLKVLQAILDEAKGQPGLARMRKMVNKMVKRLKAAQEGQKLLRNELKAAPRKEISQKLHPAYANKEPTFTSFQPPSIAADREPDAVIDVPPNVVGWVIGKAGIRINEIQQRTDAAMWVDQSFPPGEMRKLHIHGNKTQVEAAKAEVEFLMNSAPVNNARPNKLGEGLPPGHPDLQLPPRTKSYTNRMLECPHALVGYLIGKKGAMIKRIKAHSSANVEVYQQFPDGVPRKVFISGTPECVELAAFMVEEVIASGKAADAPVSEESMLASSAASAGSGPVLGFTSPLLQDSPATSMDTITHDFGDLGGLGAGAAAGSYLRMNGAAAALPPSDTQSAIDKLHARMVPPDLPVPDVAAAAAPGFPMGVHEEYLAQQEALRVQRQQQQQWHPPHGQQHWPPAHEQHQQHTHSALFQMHQQWQLQQQHQQHQLFQAQEQQQLIQHEQQRQLQEQQAHSHAAIVAPAKQPPPPPHAPPPVGRNISNGSGAQEESGKTAPLYGSVEELLAAVGYLNLLPNFLEQEFDVNAIALMQDRDFEEIQVPKGPQLKIQRACRAAGLGPSAGANGRASSGGSTASTGGDRPKTCGEKEKCAACQNEPVQVTFVPCGHQICCVKCGEHQIGAVCPMPKCTKKIDDAIRFFSG